MSEGTRPVRAPVAVLIGALAATLLSACGSADPGAEPSASSASDSSSSTSSSSASATATGSSTTSISADPSHAVDAPGPRTGALVPADLLVVSPEPISDETIAKVKAATGVSGVAQVSVADLSVEDRLLHVMAVDPSTYRNFTPVQSADNLELWQRVAGGEIAVATDLQSAVATDDDGYLTLGAEEDAPSIHVGAWAPQVSGVDAVVNEKWGESLGMVSGNALIITTADRAPDRVVKPVRKVVGSGVSVQRIDVVAQYGLDTDAVQVTVTSGTVAQAVGTYTYRVANGKVTPSAAWVKSHITTEVVPILGAVTCNKELFPQLKAALAEVVDRGLASTIHSTAGCYYPRFIAGTTSLSNHAFGLAIDINAPENGRGTVGQMDRSVVQIFKTWGFTWGGDWHYTDPMHFEMNRIVHPG
ncbi:MAG: M15 family metallopeptidase [Nocardioides sp.]|uniref:M15 family metallopeptidase n=1 Tax=Nocardioides sp. TaxID=35761 RepID=UPI0039E48355